MRWHPHNLLCTALIAATAAASHAVHASPYRAPHNSSAPRAVAPPEAPPAVETDASPVDLGVARQNIESALDGVDPDSTLHRQLTLRLEWVDLLDRAVTLTDGAVPHDAVTHDAVTHDAVTHDAVTHDAVTHDAVTHDAAAAPADAHANASARQAPTAAATAYVAATCLEAAASSNVVELQTLLRNTRVWWEAAGFLRCSTTTPDPLVVRTIAAATWPARQEILRSELNTASLTAERTRGIYAAILVAQDLARGAQLTDAETAELLLSAIGPDIERRQAALGTARSHGNSGNPAFAVLPPSASWWNPDQLSLTERKERLEQQIERNEREWDLQRRQLQRGLALVAVLEQDPKLSPDTAQRCLDVLDSLSPERADALLAATQTWWTDASFMHCTAAAADPEVLALLSLPSPDARSAALATELAAPDTTPERRTQLTTAQSVVFALADAQSRAEPTDADVVYEILRAALSASPDRRRDAIAAAYARGQYQREIIQAPLDGSRTAEVSTRTGMDAARYQALELDGSLGATKKNADGPCIVHPHGEPSARYDVEVVDGFAKDASAMGPLTSADKMAFRESKLRARATRRAQWFPQMHVKPHPPPVVLILGGGVAIIEMRRDWFDTSLESIMVKYSPGTCSRQDLLLGARAMQIRGTTSTASMSALEALRAEEEAVREAREREARALQRARNQE
jgi:hypothetical protein